MHEFHVVRKRQTRPIDAPKIQDRQIHKAYTKNVLLPLYIPDMIWNNGASLEGKGLHFFKVYACSRFMFFLQKVWS